MGFFVFDNTFSQMISGEKSKANECVLMSCLFGWGKTMEWEEFYKTDRELAEETLLSEFQISKARENLISSDLIFVIRKGIPCKIWYRINCEKIKALGSEYVKKCLCNPQKTQLPKKWETRVVKSEELESQKLGNKLPKNYESIYRTNNTSHDTHNNNPPTPLSPKPSSRLTNEFLDSKFKEFLDIANLTDYPLSKQQEARTLFFGQLQSDLDEHTIDDFLACARAYYVENRPTDPKYIIQPHNFISKKQVGTNHRINPWKDWIGKGTPEKKTITMEEAKQKILSGEW